MKLAIVLLLFLLAPVLHAAENKPFVGGREARPPVADAVQPTEKGVFNLQLAVVGISLKTGINSLDITIRDKAGKTVEDARLTVTPWSVETGQGVWEKTTVTERGDGKYRIDNVSIIRDGRWDIRVAVKKGLLEDKGVFTYSVVRNEPAPAGKVEKKKGKYERSSQYYRIPNVTLLNQDGRKINLRTLVESGKPVIINFIYTTCTTICPVLSATFTNLRKDLGPNVDKVHFVSISIDPENDRPEKMKKYLSRFNAGSGWDFLTGSREDINRVLKALDAAFLDKMAHEPLYLLHGPHSDEWVRIKGLMWASDLMSELRSVEHK